MSNDSQPASEPSGGKRALAVGAKVGRFQVEVFLGTGGMGEVYRAWDPTLERSVALKALRSGEEREPGAPERFHREALALAQLNHPNVCQVHDLVEGPSGTFIAMELVEGRTLDEAAPDLKLRDKLQVIRSVALALEAAHAKGLVHRDLKPGNIMVSLGKEVPGLQVKVLDFGLARLADPQSLQESVITPAGVPNLALLQALEEAERKGGSGSQATAVSRGSGSPREISGSHSWERLTQAGIFMGSPGYTSPEQIQGQVAGSSSDVFSLGILAWELLAGEHPFPGDGRARVKAIVTGARRELKVRGLPSGTPALLKAMLETPPFKRPTAAEVAKTLGRILSPYNLVRWVAFSVVGALLLGAVANWFLGRGIISDLTRRRPARLALLPFENRTGDPRMDAVARLILPEMMETSLRNHAKLATLESESVGKARAALHLAPTGPLSPADQARLASALGAQLLLRGTLSKGPGNTYTVAYELCDGGGRIRQAGEARETGDRSVITLPLARRMSSHLLKAVDPLASQTGALPDLAPPVLEAYARGSELMDKGEFKEAAAAFQSATQAAPDFAPAVLGYAKCLVHLADVPPESVFQWARWAARAQGNRIYEMKALHQLSGRYGARGQWEASGQASREALELARSLGETSFEAGLHSTLGLNLQRQRRIPEAEAEYQQALAMFQSVDDRLQATRVLNNMAIIEKGRGNLKGAEARLQGALQTVQSYGDKWGESFITNNLGDLALAQEGGLDRAEALFHKAKGLRESIGDEHGLAYTLLGLANVSMARGDLDRAEGLLRQFHELARKTQLRPLEALALYNLAELSRIRLKLDVALGYYRRSRVLHQEIKDPLMEAHCLAGEAECLARDGRADLARPLMERSRQASTEETPYILRAQGWLARSEGRRAEAKALFAKALSDAPLHAPEIVRELKEALAR